MNYSFKVAWHSQTYNSLLVGSGVDPIDDDDVVRRTGVIPASRTCVPPVGLAFGNYPLRSDDSYNQSERLRSSNWFYV